MHQEERTITSASVPRRNSGGRESETKSPRWRSIAGERTATLRDPAARARTLRGAALVLGIVVAATLFVRLLPNPAKNGIVTIPAEVFGGLLGYLGLLFAILALVADTGVVAGSRRVQTLTTWALPYFGTIIVVLCLAALAVFHPSPFLAQIVLTATVATVVYLPVFVLGLARRSSAPEVARAALQRIEHLNREGDATSDEVKDILNDLRSSAIERWAQGDVEGYAALVDAFLASTSWDIETRGKVKKLPQLTFVELFIQIHGADRSGTLFLADRIADQIAVRGAGGDPQFAWALITVLSSALKVGFEADAGDQDALRALKVARDLGTELTARRRKVDPSLAPLLQELADMLAAEVLADTPTSRHESVWSAALESHLNLLVAIHRLSQRLGEPLAPSGPNALARLLVRVNDAGLVLERKTFKAVRTTFFSSPDTIASSVDDRIVLLGPICQSIQAVAPLNSVEETTRLIDDFVVPITSRPMDGGSARYVGQCLEVLLATDRLSPVLRMRLFDCLSTHASRSGKRADMFDALRRILEHSGPVARELTLDAIGPSLAQLLADSTPVKVDESDDRAPTAAVIEHLFAAPRAQRRELGPKYRIGLATLLDGLAADDRDGRRRVLIRLAAVLAITEGGESKDMWQPPTDAIIEALIDDATSVDACEPLWRDVVALSRPAIEYALTSGVVPLADSLFRVEMALLADPSDEAPPETQRPQDWQARARAESYEAWTMFASRSQKFEVTQEAWDEHLEAALPAPLVDHVVAEHLLNAVTNLGEWRERHADAEVPTLPEIDALLRSIAADGSAIAGMDALEAAALRTFQLLTTRRRTPAVRLTRLLRERLRAIGDVSPEERLVIVGAFRMAAAGERGRRDRVGTAQLCVQAAAAAAPFLITTQPTTGGAVDSDVDGSADRPSTSGAAPDPAPVQAPTASTTIDPDLMRLVTLLVDEAAQELQHTDRPKPTDERAWKALESTVFSLTPAVEALLDAAARCTDDPDNRNLARAVVRMVPSVWGAVQRVLSEIQPPVETAAPTTSVATTATTASTEAAPSGATDTPERTIDQRRRGIVGRAHRLRRRIREEADGRGALETASPVLTCWVSAGLYVTDALSDRRRNPESSVPNLPAHLQRLVRTRSGEPDERIRPMKEWERAELVHSIDWVADELDAISDPEGRVSMRANCFHIRKRTERWQGYHASWTALVRALSEAVEGSTPPAWSVAMIFGRVTDDGPQGGLLRESLVHPTRIEPSPSGRSAAPAIPLTELRAQLDQLVTAMLQPSEDRKASSDARRAIASVRAELADGQDAEAAFLDGLLARWNPHHRWVGERADTLLPDAARIPTTELPSSAWTLHKAARQSQNRRTRRPAPRKQTRPAGSGARRDETT